VKNKVLISKTILNKLTMTEMVKNIMNALDLQIDNTLIEYVSFMAETLKVEKVPIMRMRSRNY
jgi:hypothetical protein